MVTTILCVSGVLLAATSVARAEATFVVSSASDSADLNLKDGACDVDESVPGSQCTLRAAIQEANIATRGDTIRLGMPGDGIHTIELTSQLPTLTDRNGPTIIDGFTQAGSSPNTATLASNAKIMVQIEGRGDGLFGGLATQSPDNVVRGLSLYKLRGAIRLLGIDAHDNRVEGNLWAPMSEATAPHVKL
jgi:CSLREA domain-containing protein